MKKIIFFILILIGIICFTPKLINISQRQEVNSLFKAIEIEIKNEEYYIEIGEYHQVWITHIKIQDIISAKLDDLTYAGLWTEEDNNRLQELFLKSEKLVRISDERKMNN